jgi:hypothetical protein
MSRLGRESQGEFFDLAEPGSPAARHLSLVKLAQGTPREVASSNC